MTTTPAPNPQAEPPLQADGDTHESSTRPPPPLYSSLSHPSTAASASSASAIHAGPLTLPSSPMSSRSIASGNGGADSNTETLTNFMKYGSIRPPVSLLQEEFLEKYRSWREHAQPLEGIDVMASRDQSGDVWAGHMASIQKLHSRHIQRLSQDHAQDQRGSPCYLSDLKSSLSSSEQKFEEDEEKVSVDEEKVEDSSGNSSQVHGGFERNQLENFAALIFRPGSKLSGTIEHESSYCDYELIIMESESTDELGQPKGLLARHIFAGDVQCVFVRLSFVTIQGTQNKKEETKSDEEQEGSSSSEDEGIGDNNSLKNLPDRKLTIKMEYVDGDNIIEGLWNGDTMCFEGAVVKLTESQGDQNQMGGTIISGLISGRSSFNDDSGNDESRSGLATLLRRPTSSDVNRSFSLSPCTHLHPRGVAPRPTWQNPSAALSRLLQTAHADTREHTSASVGQDPSPPKNKLIYARITPERQKVSMEEIASHDNCKLVLHRERTEALRRETLKKLVDLGAVIDFAELARKRNVAKRREKWRRRMRKYTPHIPKRLKKRGRTSTTGDDDYDISKDKETKKVQFYDQLAAISWADLLEEASIQAEKTCATFRRQTALLSNLTFESDEYKAQVFVDLRANGLTLAGSHSEWDKCIQMGRTIALGWSWFERGSWSCFERSAVVGKRCVYLLFQMHSRLEANHKHLEKSFRGADSRLTNMQLERIKQGSATKQKSKDSSEGEESECDGLCGICQCDMDEDNEGDNNEDNPSVCLSCSHSFHWKCIREWLHDHSQCPICRVDLNAT